MKSAMWRCSVVEPRIVIREPSAVFSLAAVD